MAAAEARAAWQRTANRYLVQEDAKRAPKLACSSSSSTPQYDANGGNAPNGQDQSATTFVPLNWNPMNSNLPPDTKWWLQQQPNFGSQKDVRCEQLNAVNEFEDLSIESSAPTSKLSGTSVDHNNSDSSVESPWMVSTTFTKADSKTGVEEMKTATNVSQQILKRKVDVDEYFSHAEELMDWKPRERVINKKTGKSSPGLEMPWVRSNNCEPWWRISDKDELAMLVAHKSLEHVENCDLPRPAHTMHVSANPFGCNTIDCPQHSYYVGSMDEKFWSPSEVGNLPYDSNKLYSGPRTFPITTAKGMEDNTKLESDPSRTQLLEALRHSQTRARKAEMAAQRACDEKEDIIKLLFRQASHLFAYKQWLHMLQLESLCLQLKIKDHQLATLLPILPWMPLKKNATKQKGKKQGKCGLCKYAVVFAVGLGLAGAGLLLGWTLGWLLPQF